MNIYSLQNKLVNICKFLSGHWLSGGQTILITFLTSNAADACVTVKQTWMHGLQAEKLGGLAMSNNKAIQEWLNCSEKKTHSEAMKDLSAVEKERLARNSYSQENHSSLVRDRTSNNWKKMSLTERMLVIGEYLNTTDKYQTFSLRLSHEKMKLLEEIENKADFFRRLIQAHTYKRFQKTPAYAFVLERCPKGYLHLHGVIDYGGLPEKEVRDIFKCAAFGADFRRCPMNRYILKTDVIEEGIGWISYMLKHTKEARNYIYLSNQITREVKKYLMENKNDKYCK